ncbi:hypothetical protein [Mycolicibacter virginiensis]|nr:hypothetical protein [Mycolicibacter virginiensis]UVI51754.1 hypothetical protein MJO54_23590 [Mycolicibacter virginiensis]
MATAPDEPAVHAAVTAARVGRNSWALIGSVLGIGGEAAQQRYG